MDNSATTNLFARLGSEPGLTRLIDLQYERLLADDYLREYFMGVDIDRLKAGQISFLRATFGDPKAAYRGASLRDAHRGQLVPELAFDQFVDLFVTVAGEVGLDSAGQAEIRAALKAMRASVITEFKPNPAYDYQLKPF